MSVYSTTRGSRWATVFVDTCSITLASLISARHAGRTRRLATYGTLAPGRPDHAQLAGLSGRWLTGHVRGTLVESGWGAALGYPGLILDTEGAEVEVQVLESPDLPKHVVPARRL